MTQPPVEVIRVLANTAGGPEFLEWLLRDVCAIFRSPMGQTEHDMKYLCGKQDVGYVLLPLVVEACPSVLTKIMEKV